MSTVEIIIKGTIMLTLIGLMVFLMIMVLRDMINEIGDWVIKKYRARQQKKIDAEFYDVVEERKMTAAEAIENTRKLLWRLRAEATHRQQLREFIKKKRYPRDYGGTW